MNGTLVGYIVLYSLSAIVCLASIPRARTIQHPDTRQGVVTLLLSVAIWSGGYVGYFLAPTDTTRLAFYILGFVFAFVAVGAWLYFCAAYTGRSPRQAPYRNVALAVFVGAILLKVTNPLHSLYFTTEWTTEPFPHLAIHHQLLYWVHLGLSYAVIAVGFFMLIERFYHTGTDSRPLVVLAGLTALPAGATILNEQIQGLLPLMYEPPGVALFAVGTLFVYLQRFEAIQLTGGAEEPAIFLDQETRVRDYNQAARELFPDLQGSIAAPVETVDPVLTPPFTGPEILTVAHDGESRFYEVSSSPFMSGEVLTGQLLTVTDVTERESYRQQLEERTDQLEALNRVVRHDIRNDMSVILGWGETLDEHVSDEGEESLAVVLETAQHVVELTEIAGDVVESLTGAETVDLEPVDLDRILNAELAAVRTSHPHATVGVVGEIPAVGVRANEMLSSVFRNLFENAVRHTDKETPEITVSCEEHAEWVRVRVADNGPGIPDDQKETIFGKGEKGLDSSGTGIGLYLVHTLVEKCGGEVWVEDNEPEGAVFVVELSKAD